MRWWHQQQPNLRCWILNEIKGAFIQEAGRAQGAESHKDEKGIWVTEGNEVAAMGDWLYMEGLIT